MTKNEDESREMPILRTRFDDSFTRRTCYFSVMVRCIMHECMMWHNLEQTNKIMMILSIMSSLPGGGSVGFLELKSSIFESLFQRRTLKAL